MFQPRLGFAWDAAGNGRSVLRGSWGIYNARQNMLTQVGAITTNGIQQQSIPAGTLPVGAGVTVFSKDYANPRIYTTNAAFQQRVAQDVFAYVDFAWSKGVHLTRFINPNANSVLFKNLGDVTDTVSSAKSLYRGVTFGVRKRFSRRFQLEGNYTYSQDWDDDSNERDPFKFRYFDLNRLYLEYSPSDRDERHKFNFFSYWELGKGFIADARMQAHSAQPISPDPRKGADRNSLRKNNEFFSFDWRLQRPFKLNERFAIVPQIEMFNTFNNANNVNPLISPGLFNFDGFLRQGVGDPRQAQLSVKLTF